jgi:hypothetical protein
MLRLYGALSCDLIVFINNHYRRRSPVAGLCPPQCRPALGKAGPIAEST